MKLENLIKKYQVSLNEDLSWVEFCDLACDCSRHLIGTVISKNLQDILSDLLDGLFQKSIDQTDSPRQLSSLAVIIMEHAGSNILIDSALNKAEESSTNSFDFCSVAFVHYQIWSLQKKNDFKRILLNSERTASSSIDFIRIAFIYNNYLKQKRKSLQLLKKAELKAKTAIELVLIEFLYRSKLETNYLSYHTLINAWAMNDEYSK